MLFRAALPLCCQDLRGDRLTLEEDTQLVCTGPLQMRSVKGEACGDSSELPLLYSGTPGLAVAHTPGGLLHGQRSFVWVSSPVGKMDTKLDVSVLSFTPHPLSG